MLPTVITVFKAFIWLLLVNMFYVVCYFFRFTGILGNRQRTIQEHILHEPFQNEGHHGHPSNFHYAQKHTTKMAVMYQQFTVIISTPY